MRTDSIYATPPNDTNQQLRKIVLRQNATVMEQQHLHESPATSSKPSTKATSSSIQSKKTYDIRHRALLDSTIEHIKYLYFLFQNGKLMLFC